MSATGYIHTHRMATHDTFSAQAVSAECHAKHFEDRPKLRMRPKTAQPVGGVTHALHGKRGGRLMFQGTGLGSPYLLVASRAPPKLPRGGVSQAVADAVEKTALVAAGAASGSLEVADELPAVPSGTPVLPGAAMAEGEGEGKGISTACICVIVAVVLVVLALVCAICYNKSNKSKPPKTPTSTITRTRNPSSTPTLSTPTLETQTGAQTGGGAALSQLSQLFGNS